MVIINNREWITLNDEIKVNGKKIVKIYEADRKIYPRASEVRVYWQNYDIDGHDLPFTENWPVSPTVYSVEQLYDYAKAHPCITSRTDEGNGKYTIVYEQDGAILTLKHAPKDMIGVFYRYYTDYYPNMFWPDFFMYSKIGDISDWRTYGLDIAVSGNIQGQNFTGGGSFIYNE